MPDAVVVKITRDLRTVKFRNRVIKQSKNSFRTDIARQTRIGQVKQILYYANLVKWKLLIPYLDPGITKSITNPARAIVLAPHCANFALGLAMAAHHEFRGYGHIYSGIC